mmetsp:Transcript_3691/g.11475  ORF Transcript_3691/g.11475 Transcript_3691/m.11475 type:complete len:296 (+) Transcript_3691:1769-2656(+)
MRAGGEDHAGALSGEVVRRRGGDGLNETAIQYVVHLQLILLQRDQIGMSKHDAVYALRELDWFGLGEGQVVEHALVAVAEKHLIVEHGHVWIGATCLVHCDEISTLDIQSHVVLSMAHVDTTRVPEEVGRRLGKCVLFDHCVDAEDLHHQELALGEHAQVIVREALDASTFTQHSRAEGLHRRTLGQRELVDGLECVHLEDPQSAITNGDELAQLANHFHLLDVFAAAAKRGLQLLACVPAHFATATLNLLDLVHEHLSVRGAHIQSILMRGNSCDSAGRDREEGLDIEGSKGGT